MVRVDAGICDDSMVALTQMAYQGTDIFLLLFSYEDVNSLESIRSKWAPQIFQAVYEPRAMVLVGLRGKVRENYQELEAMGESPFCESPIKDEMIQEVMRDIRAHCFVECCPQINYRVQVVLDRAVAIYLGVEGLEGKKGPGKKHHGARKSSKCNVA